MNYNSNVPFLGNVMWGWDSRSNTIHFGRVIEPGHQCNGTLLYVYEKGTPYYINVQIVNYRLEDLKKEVLERITKIFDQAIENESTWN
jgi:hypothetical protein